MQVWAAAGALSSLKEKQGGQETFPHGNVAHHHDSALRGTCAEKVSMVFPLCAAAPAPWSENPARHAVSIFLTFHLPTCIVLLRVDTRVSFQSMPDGKEILCT